jgi:hypothetical protein
MLLWAPGREGPISYTPKFHVSGSDIRHELHSTSLSVFFRASRLEIPSNVNREAIPESSAQVDDDEWAAEI